MPDTSKLLQWYDRNHRDLPWRHTSDPYKIWLSEIILQQTRVDQGLKYYLQFIKQYPTVHDLAGASEDEVLKLWQGLGYYSRARNLHHSAKTIVEKLGGKFPQNYAEIIKLKGIGPYTAAAIASIVYGEAVPVVDGNVMRVVSRWFAIEEPVNTGKGRKKIEAALNLLISKSHPGKFNQAMMEFGALHCTPKSPGCSECVFREQCLAYHKGVVHKLPVKSPKVIVRNRFFNYLVIIAVKKSRKFTFLNKRKEGDIWQGLYEFPLIETLESMPVEELMRFEAWQNILENHHYEIQRVSNEFTHQLTHQRINARFFTISLVEISVVLKENFLMVPLNELGNYPVSRLTDKFLQQSGI